MKFLIFLSILAFTKAVIYNVSNISDLKSRLSTVQPGDVINMADGIYDGPLKITRNGTSTKPITLSGSKQAYIISNSYGVHLYFANYWILKGFTVKDCKKGVFLEASNFNTIDNLLVHRVEEEAVHFRNASCDNILKNSIIKTTGLAKPGYGEGVYIGSAVSNWANKKPDLSHRNQILNNRFGPNITAEAIDIKEGTEGNIIDGNFFDGTGLSGVNFADSWIDVKGYKNIIKNNNGTISRLDGFQVHQVEGSVANSGCYNQFSDNICSKLASGGVCVNLESNPCGNKSTNNVKV